MYMYILYVICFTIQDSVFHLEEALLGIVFLLKVYACFLLRCKFLFGGHGFCFGKVYTCTYQCQLNSSV